MTTPATATSVAVVVPALNEERCIEACLASVLAQDGSAEVMVVDGGSGDATAALAAPLAPVLHAPRGRARQMNAGARATRGDPLLFLHADSRLPPGAFAAMRAALADARTVGGTFSLRFEPETPLLRAYAACTRLGPRIFHYGDQGIFVRRTVFDALGGYRDLPLMEDVDFLRRLRGVGRTVLLPLPVTTSARRFQRHGIVRQQLRNGVLLAVYLAGISPHRLARWYEQVHR